MTTTTAPRDAKGRCRWTPEADEDAALLLGGGATLAEIAARIGVPPASLRRRLDYLRRRDAQAAFVASAPPVPEPRRSPLRGEPGFDWAAWRGMAPEIRPWIGIRIAVEGGVNG